MSTQTTKASFTNHQSPEAHRQAGLPELPRSEELFWATYRKRGLPPLSHMLSESVISRRLYIRAGIIGLVERDRSKAHLTPILASDLPNLGLPELPNQSSERPAVCGFESLKQKQDTENRSCELKLVSESFSALYHYGVDDAALNKVLAATAMLIDRMPSQSAVDCLMDMPVWMRNIFLARYGVSNIIGMLLGARLEDSGETSMISCDGTIAALNKLGPDVVSFAKDLAFPEMDIQSSPLARLTTRNVKRRNGISIRNPNIAIEQTPRIGRSKAATLL